MRIVRVTTLLLAVSLVPLGACKKKKPPVPPPVQQAPTIQQPQPQTPAPAPPPAKPQATTPAPTKPAPRTAPNKKTVTRKPAPKPQAAAPKTPPVAPKTPTRVVVDNDEPRAATPGLSASVSRNAAGEQRRATEHLLQTSELNLRELNRTLSDDEELFVQRVRSFIAQSRSATELGDHERAYNLALKAQLLSEELLKH